MNSGKKIKENAIVFKVITSDYDGLEFVSEPLSMPELLDNVKRLFSTYGIYKVFRRFSYLFTWIARGGFEEKMRSFQDLINELDALKKRLEVIESDLSNTKRSTRLQSKNKSAKSS